ncbi:MAG: HAMP domain-containing protein [Anaerolineae bacterium]
MKVKDIESVGTFRSLSFKLVLVLSVALIATLSLLFYVEYIRHRDRLIAQRVATATLQSDLIESSLQHSMMTQDPDELRTILNDLGKQQDIVSILLLDKSGKITASPNAEEIGKRLDLSDSTCQLCHQRDTAQKRSRTVIFKTDSGEEVLRNVNPVENRQECHSCHDPQSAISGVILADFSMAEVNKEIGIHLRETIAILLSAIVVVVLIASLVMNQIVLTRLKILVQAMRRLGQGELDQRLELKGNDEISELATSFNRMAQSLKEKTRLESEISKLQRARAKELARAKEEIARKASQLQQLLTKTISVQEEERARIAHDMHDGVTQLIIGALYEIQAARERLPSQPEEATERLRTVQDLLTRVETETRRVIHDLRPTGFDTSGLIPALKRYAVNYHELFDISCSVRISGKPWRLPPDKEVAIFRIVQEALHNTEAHAEASSVQVRLDFGATELKVSVEDDGRGFAYEAAGRDFNGRLGLLGMKQRAESMGGEIEIRSAPGHGTRIILRIPATSDQNVHSGGVQNEQDQSFGC